MCMMETPMKKPTKGVKGRRNHPYGKKEVVPKVKKEGIPEFKKEWRKNHPGPIQIDGVHSKNEEPKKNWAKKKNVKNLSLDLNSHAPVMQAPVTVVYPSEIPNPEMTTEEPLSQLANLVELINPEYVQEVPQSQPQDSPPLKVNVMEEGEISEAGNFQYDTPEDLLANVGVCYPCPIHNVGTNEVHSQKEWVQDVYLTCPVDNCPVFTSLKEYSTYYDRCRRQGHEWFFNRLPVSSMDRALDCCAGGASKSAGHSAHKTVEKKSRIEQVWDPWDKRGWDQSKPYSMPDTKRRKGRAKGKGWARSKRRRKSGGKIDLQKWINKLGVEFHWLAISIWNRVPN
ncbi:hypothetical protein AWC38_SpisGene405 [Stylophora pistillata]|uniref:Uncharacterized protein n=1 Tax=Stylophora pistillata TaxID=50429 RepID=A0A2B4T1F8_STYPI|nr:hypothetical protein AWC38_SpisGene405 [Stylophora pistillata]